MAVPAVILAIPHFQALAQTPVEFVNLLNLFG